MPLREFSTPSNPGLTLAQEFCEWNSEKKSMSGQASQAKSFVVEVENTQKKDTVRGTVTDMVLC